MDGREERGDVFFGNRGPWRKRVSFSQGAGPFVGVGFIGLISTAKERGNDRGVATPPWTFFLSDIRDRG